MVQMINQWRQVYWLSKAAEQGNGGAQFFLGILYRDGYGVPRDDVVAMEWFMKAAKQNITAAQTQIGYMYLNGKGVPENYVESYAWFSIAAAQGDDRSKKIMEELSKILTREQIIEGQKLSKEYWKIHSPAGD